MSTMDITAKLREIKELQALIDEAQTEIEALKDAVKAEMTDIFRFVHLTASGSFALPLMNLGIISRKTKVTKRLGKLCVCL